MLLEHLGIAARSLPEGFWPTSGATAAKRKIAESVGAVLGFQHEVTISPGRHILSRAEITRAALRVLDEHALRHS